MIRMVITITLVRFHFHRFIPKDYIDCITGYVTGFVIFVVNIIVIAGLNAKIRDNTKLSVIIAIVKLTVAAVAIVEIVIASAEVMIASVALPDYL